MNKCILSVLFLFASFNLYADDDKYQSHDILKNTIETYVINKLPQDIQGTIQVSSGAIDTRLNLKACADNQLEVFNPYQTALVDSSTMGIKCNEVTNHWTLYVPIKISILKNVLVARHGLAKGARITKDDLYETEMDAQKLKQGYFTNSNDLIGLICKQNIAPNASFNPFNIELEKLIHKGEQVTISAHYESLTVKMDGIAQDDGAYGETIKVKNRSSKRIIEAKVSGQKKVKIIL